MKNEILIGENKLHRSNAEVKGEFIEINNASYYKIENCDLMDPFFMTIVSNADHWMFISSNGALTAGRKNPDFALFPYYTVDKIHDSADITGSKTIILATIENKTYLWEPFSDKYKGSYSIQRNIYKSVYGNSVIFEEINETLQLVFSYSWQNSEQFGFIKQAVCKNISGNKITITLLDGIQNILPSGINRSLQQAYSNLVDAYKKNELLETHQIGLFTLSSIIVDKAEPSEALTANIVWSAGITTQAILLSSKQLQDFREEKQVHTEADVRAARGAYFIHAEFELASQSENNWYIVADVNKDAGNIVDLQNRIQNTSDIAALLMTDVQHCTNDLVKRIAAADGLQLTNDPLSINRHLANVLFNIMRGGIFNDNYAIDKQDLLAFIHHSNTECFSDNYTFLESLPGKLNYTFLIHSVIEQGNTQLLRLCYEYLPLTFSRRHGDPSRPWNQFSIEIKKPDGTINLTYQGNWRDIFQNWEALSISYPAFVESMISKFLNASTADGYNPYRITREGIDWEIPDPHDPWAHIGYWGDHQIIYLQKFLEVSQRYHPGVLQALAAAPVFSYAHVPYRIKSYTELIQNPFDTIVYDYAAEKLIQARMQNIGSDGKLLSNADGKVYLVNFTEKLLVTILAKLSNYIPDAGIWLNTQRPEWNDANNALVGNGVSMVTLYYMRRMLHFCNILYRDIETQQFELSEEVFTLFQSLKNTFTRYADLLPAAIDDSTRKSVADALGNAGSTYRESIYTNGFSEIKKQISQTELTNFFEVVLQHIDATIRRNKRPDNLYHAYNLITITDSEIQIRHLYEMLEGQVAVLSAEILDTQEVNAVLDALKTSAMFRADQYSYLLYPDRQLPLFMQKNIIPQQDAEKLAVLQKMIAENNTSVLYKDAAGKYHFNSAFKNANDLKQTLLAMPEIISEHDQEYILQLFEKVFDHKSFTGRSGTFYGFEGLGCIYWHMVSKLMLAVNENYFKALHENPDPEHLGKMVQHYYDIRAGIGLNKSPALFGAFPTDAYSHTPGNGGAKQPGMTGQVKEDIISRFGELGVIVESGKIKFNPGLLRKSEFLAADTLFRYVNRNAEFAQLEVPSACLAFTFCQLPVIYHLAVDPKIEVTDISGNVITIEGLILDENTSSAIFNRSEEIERMDVYLMPRLQ